MVFYFSGTGNTLFAARMLSQSIGDELVSIADALDEKRLEYIIEKGEQICICFPVHGWFPPKIVRRFISSLVINTKDNSKPYICSICTCGDDVGLAMDTMRKDLSLRGLTLNSAWSLKMPESYVALPFMYTDNKEREQEKISVATAKMEDIIKAVKEHKIGVWDVYRGPCAWLKTHVIGRWFNHYRITDNKFHVDADKCSHCGTCSKKCPVRNITLIDGVPSWKGNGTCTACLACYHHCPHHAINYGHWTKTRGQYYKK